MLSERRRATVITALAKELRERGSWCGETHLQKAAYVLQELLHVPTGYEFVLYKYGPYAFDFHAELGRLRAQEFLSLERQPYPYGPRLETTDRARRLQARFPKTLARYGRQIDFVADQLGTKGVTDLEQLATALLVTLDREAGDSVDARAAKLTEVKPHISGEAAARAVEAADRLIGEAEQAAA